MFYVRDGVTHVADKYRCVEAAGYVDEAVAYVIFGGVFYPGDSGSAIFDDQGCVVAVHVGTYDSQLQHNCAALSIGQAVTTVLPVQDVYTRLATELVPIGDGERDGPEIFEAKGKSKRKRHLRSYGADYCIDLIKSIENDRHSDKHFAYDHDTESAYLLYNDGPDNWRDRIAFRFERQDIDAAIIERGFDLDKYCRENIHSLGFEEDNEGDAFRRLARHSRRNPGFYKDDDWNVVTHTRVKYESGAQDDKQPSCNFGCHGKKDERDDLLKSPPAKRATKRASASEDIGFSVKGQSERRSKDVGVGTKNSDIIFESGNVSGPREEGRWENSMNHNQILNHGTSTSNLSGNLASPTSPIRFDLDCLHRPTTFVVKKLDLRPNEDMQGALSGEIRPPSDFQDKNELCLNHGVRPYSNEQKSEGVNLLPLNQSLDTILEHPLEYHSNLEVTELRKMLSHCMSRIDRLHVKDCSEGSETSGKSSRKRNPKNKEKTSDA
jgi:hypothetical protein